ncbi:MAG: PIN domain-containing protein [Deltaproteobacteria bacterium]|nr:MAG: PIN domain-containing protein [Deltaproteobacteria bacterium]
MAAKNVKIFLDSNVILSGLLSDKSYPRIILDLLSLEVPLLKGLTGKYNLEEIERNLKSRFPKILPIYQHYFEKIKLEIIPLPSARSVSSMAKKMSPKDTPVLVSAKNGKANYLITGDKKGFPKEMAKPILIVSPAEFIEEVLPTLIYQKN